jgi:hypothetical protein
MTDAIDTSAENAVRAAVDCYRRSIDDADVGFAASVWATTADVSFIHPRGSESGWTAIRENFYVQTMGALFSTRTLRLHDVAVHIHRDSAWVEFRWDFEALFRVDGSPLSTRGRESQVYHRFGETWRLVHVHYSAMPVTGDREGF